MCEDRVNVERGSSGAVLKRERARACERERELICVIYTDGVNVERALQGAGP
jgi:hypothetical protein